MRESVLVRDVSLRFGTTTALDRATVSFPPGCFTALVGANGCGKSTLLGVLAGTLHPTRGDVTGLPRNVALVSQHSTVPELFPVTVRNTVTMGRWRRRGCLRPLTRADRTAVDRALDRTGVADLADRTFGDLSGGQRKRVLIAQGLAQEAPLLLLDEPLAALDVVSSGLIGRAISAERDSGTTVIVATHDPDQAADADRTITLDQGRPVSVTDRKEP